MSRYKIHRKADGTLGGFGPNNDQYAPYIELGDTLEYTDELPPPTSDQLFATLRAARDARLVATDKCLLADHPISPEELVTIKAYRQALRDLPAQPGAPWDGGGELTPWPHMPEV